MNKHTFFLFLAIIITSCSNAQGNSDIPLPSGKSIYIPISSKAWISIEPGSQWSYHRMAGHRELHHLLGRRGFIMTSATLLDAGGAFHEGEPCPI